MPSSTGQSEISPLGDELKLPLFFGKSAQTVLLSSAVPATKKCILMSKKVLIPGEADCQSCTRDVVEDY